MMNLRVILLNDRIERAKNRVQLKYHVYFWTVCDNHTHLASRERWHERISNPPPSLSRLLTLAAL